MNEARVLQTADVDERAILGPGTTVWHLAQVREDARLGSGCIVGRGAYVGPGVTIGNNVKLQNYALVYEPATLEDDVFIGPAAVLTNDLYPRRWMSPASSSALRIGTLLAWWCGKADRWVRVPWS